MSRPVTDSLRHNQDPQVRRYSSKFSDSMEMLAPAETVAQYLDNHQQWFQRCAAPMSVRAVNHQTYALTLGQFANFGFEIEPTIALKLLPQLSRVYRIETEAMISQSIDLNKHYDVDFKATMHLLPCDLDQSAKTIVQWDLDLSVWVRLPRVITMLPETLVQSSGDHLLRQIVRQISRRLTWKVQEDFHASQGLRCPKRLRAAF